SSSHLLISPRPTTGHRPTRRCSKNSSASASRSSRSATRARIRANSGQAFRPGSCAADSRCADQTKSKTRSVAATIGSIENGIAPPVGAALVLFEHLGDLRVAHRLAGGVEEQVLLGHVGDVLGLRVLCEQMIERLVLARPPIGGNRLVPLLGVVELGI